MFVIALSCILLPVIGKRFFSYLLQASKIGLIFCNLEDLANTVNSISGSVSNRN